MKGADSKHKLSPAQVSVMQHRVTEPPYFGRYWDHFDEGMYRCAACETPLFSSDDKFDSNTGWPSFKKPLHEKDLQFKSEPGPDDKVEVRCKKCKSHLGYVIAGDAPYYRINSVCLIFEKPIVAVAAAVAAIPAPIKVFPETDASISHEPSNEAYSSRRSWSIASIVVGAIAGILVGTGVTSLYFSRLISSFMPSTATSTVEIATSTAGLSPSTASELPATETEPSEAPAETPVILPDTAQESNSPAPIEATTTQ